MGEGELAEIMDRERQRRRDGEKAGAARGPVALLLPLALAVSRLVARLDAAEAHR